MSLADWLRNGWLVEHKTSPQEIAELLAIADRDLRECQASVLSPDWRLAIAYNSALQAATAALAAAGYRATREGHHYRIIQSLAYTIGAEADLIAKIDGFRKSATSVIMNDRVRFRFKKPEKCSFLPGSFGAPWPGGWKKIIRSFSRSELAQA